MMVIVTDARFETRRRPRRLDAPDDAFANQDAQRVVHRLQRDRANLGAYGVGHAVRGDMRMPRHCSQHSQSLRRDLKTMLSKKLRRVGDHAGTE
jgi:hypothetical protein